MLCSLSAPVPVRREGRGKSREIRSIREIGSKEVRDAVEHEEDRVEKKEKEDEPREGEKEGSIETIHTSLRNPFGEGCVAAKSAIL
jgi:hypothetical protein